jgi:uncharacterized phage protein gp47/JayE
MPYARPTLTGLIDDATADFTVATIVDEAGNALDGMLPIGVVPALLLALSGQSYGQYGYLDWISLQSVPWTATDEYLSGWAGLRGVYRKGGDTASGTVTFPAVDGTPMAAATPIVRSDGVAYVAPTGGTASGASITVDIVATAPGAGGTFADGTTFRLQNSIAGIANESSASALTASGTDIEEDDDFRSRMLAVYAAPPQGGDRQDYIEWALAVPIVTRAWVAPHMAGPGTVSVYFMADVTEAAFDGFPQGANGVAAADWRDVAATGDQLIVANALYAPQPVTALVYALAPAPEPVAFTVADLGAANTPENRTAITTALATMFHELGQVGGTVNPADGTPWPGIEPDAWYQAIEALTGLSGFKVTVPGALITPTDGSLFTVGTVTFLT